MGGYLSYECCMCGHYVQPDEYMTCPHSKRTTAKLVELKEIEQQLPATFYAGLPLVERVKTMVDYWRRALQVNKELQTERDDLQALFDLQHTRTVVADKAWQKAHNEPDILPDLGELIEWLLNEKTKADQVEPHGDSQERAEAAAPADKEARGR